jgi:RHS repeat-associated protein
MQAVHSQTALPGGVLPAILPLSADPNVAPNSPPGFDTFRSTFLPAMEPFSSLNALEISAGLRQTSLRSRSTGKERDQETGLDYFGARYYGGALGRFGSPDKPLNDQSASDPQSWNLYGYVRNNPLTYTDADGQVCTHDNNGFHGDCATPGDETVTQGDKPQQFTVCAFDCNSGIAALAAVGAKLTNPHEWVQLTSDAGRATASVAWPGASAVAECITPGGNCDKTNLVMAAIPLPGWSRLTIDIEHIAERHMAGGALTGGRSVFVNLDKEGVKAAIRQAYGSAKTVSVQGERVLLEGVTNTGMTVQMWLNKTTNVIETAYPVSKQF